MCKGDAQKHFPSVQNFEVLVISRGLVGDGPGKGQERVNCYVIGQNSEPTKHTNINGCLRCSVHLSTHPQHNKTCPKPPSTPTPHRSTYPHYTDTMPLVVPGITSNGSGDKTEEWMNKLVGKKISESEPSNETVSRPDPKDGPG